MCRVLAHEYRRLRGIGLARGNVWQDEREKD
jgi:hypothetical protein